MFKSFATALIAAVAQADNAHDDVKIGGLVQGFFVGAFDFHGMTDVAHCVSDANPVEQHFENAMRGFWNGSYQEATKAIDQLGLSVSDIGDMLDHCGKIDHHDYEQIQRMAEAFLHPKQILLEANESLIINGVNVFEDTREGLHDYRMGKWVDAGEHFGQAAAMLLYGKTQMVDHEELFFDFDNHWQELLDQIDHEKDEKMHHFEAMKSSNVHFTFFRMGKILEGMLAGSVEAEVPHGVECLRDAKHIWERFGGVIDQLKHATFNSVLHGVEDLGHVLHDVANELEECKATVGTDLDKLREMSKAFTDPWYFIFHVEHDLIVNGQDVHHEIMDAQAQWENQHFYEFGHSVGLALSKIFLGGQMKNDIPRHHLPTHGREHTPVHYAANDKKDDTNYIYESRYHHADVPVYDHNRHYATDYFVPTSHHETTLAHYDNAEKTEDNMYHASPVSHHETTVHYDNAEKDTENSEKTEENRYHGHEYGREHGYGYGEHGEHGIGYGEHGYSHHAEPAHHERSYLTHELAHEYTHEDPSHYIEREGYHHETHHDEPRVVHDTPIHHEVPHIIHPHHEEHHQEEPHVEFETEAHEGPVHHEHEAYVPHHTREHYEHEYSPSIAHHFYAEHETHRPVHHERRLEHEVREASHHYYQN